MSVPGAWQACSVAFPVAISGRRHRPHRSPRARTAAHPPARRSRPPVRRSRPPARRSRPPARRSRPAGSGPASRYRRPRSALPSGQSPRSAAACRFQHATIGAFRPFWSPLGPNSRAKGKIVAFCAVSPVLSVQFGSSDGLFRHRYCGQLQCPQMPGALTWRDDDWRYVAPRSAPRGRERPTCCRYVARLRTSGRCPPDGRRVWARLPGEPLPEVILSIWSILPCRHGFCAWIPVAYPARSG